MRKLFWLLLAVLAVVACKKEVADYALFSGKVENAKGLKEIRVKGSNDFFQVIAVEEDGAFVDTLRFLKTGYYTLQIGRANLPMYLEQGDSLAVIVNLLSKDNPLSFSGGKAVVVNNYIAKKAEESQKKITQMGGPQGIFGMEPDTFLVEMNKIKDEELKQLDETADLPKKFIDLETKTINYNYLYNLSLYPNYHAYVIKKEDFEAPQSITKPLEELNYTNEKDYDEIGIYKQLVLSHFMDKYYDKDSDKKSVIKEIKNAGGQSLQRDFAAELARGLNLGAKDLEKKAEQIRTLTSDEKVLKSLEEFLSTADALSEGKASPVFSYENIKGKKVALEDLKGKLVYIDVWATWCGPCKGEIPHLQKLEKDYHNKAVHFVSISIDEDKAAWEKMVKDKKLGGIQLHAGGEARKSEFVKAYKINGIPRFILLDKEGKIISADAPRPSTDQIRAIIDKSLSK